MLLFNVVCENTDRHAFGVDVQEAPLQRISELTLSYKTDLQRTIYDWFQQQLKACVYHNAFLRPGVRQLEPFLESHGIDLISIYRRECLEAFIRGFELPIYEDLDHAVLSVTYDEDYAEFHERCAEEGMDDPFTFIKGRRRRSLVRAIDSLYEASHVTGRGIAKLYS